MTEDINHQDRDLIPSQVRGPAAHETTSFGSEGADEKNVIEGEFVRTQDLDSKWLRGLAAKDFEAEQLQERRNFDDHTAMEAAAELRANFPDSKALASLDEGNGWLNAASLAKEEGHAAFAEIFAETGARQAALQDAQRFEREQLQERLHFDDHAAMEAAAELRAKFPDSKALASLDEGNGWLNGAAIAKEEGHLAIAEVFAETGARQAALRDEQRLARENRLEEEQFRNIVSRESESPATTNDKADSAETLIIDDATRQRLAEIRENDRDAVEKSLSQSVTDKFVADLDSRMEKSQLEERGWRDRGDIDDVMRDLERLAGRDWQSAAKLWDKYRPGDLDKPIFIDGDDVDVKRTANTPSERGSTNESNEKNKEFVTPDVLRKRYLQAENKFYFRDDENKLAFEVKGKRLATEHNDPEIARSMVELAEAKGWNSIKLKGAEEFKREVWLQASLKGMEVQGFHPRDVDHARLADLRKETHQSPNKDSKSLNTIDHSPERSKQATPEVSDRSAIVDESQRSLSKSQQQAVEAIKAVMRDRGDSEKAINMAADIAAERFQTNRVYVGKILEHGAAPFENNKNNELSYYVKLQTDAGEKTVWGVDLQRAIDKGAAQPGDDIALAYQGRQPVTVKVKERDKNGVVIKTTEETVNRNAWDVRKLETVREEVKERLAQAANRGDRQPLLKVYDRDAQRSEQRPEPLRDQRRENERARG